MYFLLILFGLNILVLLLIFPLFFLIRKDPKKRNAFLSILVAFLSMNFVFWILELGFFFFYDASDGTAFTLAYQRWHKKYWKPINSHGFRDFDYAPITMKDKKIIYLVGDSFVAGHGINNPDDRFSNILNKKLPDDWLVLNIAVNGWGTLQQNKAVRNLPFQPKIIILSYFINDIEHAMVEYGFQSVSKPIFNYLPKKPFSFVINRSNLLNFCYWRYFRSKQYSRFSSDYAAQLNKAYQNKKILKTHLSELNRMVNFSREKDAIFMVVFFPNLSFIDQSHEQMEPIITFMREKVDSAIDLTLELDLTNWQQRNLIVNQNDAHPSVKLNRAVGELLYKKILQFKKPSLITQ